MPLDANSPIGPYASGYQYVNPPTTDLGYATVTNWGGTDYNPGSTSGTDWGSFGIALANGLMSGAHSAQQQPKFESRNYADYYQARLRARLQSMRGGK